MHSLPVGLFLPVETVTAACDDIVGA